jgi:hypothetical protein
MGRMSQFASSWECDRSVRGKRGGPLAASDYQISRHDFPSTRSWEAGSV